SQTPGLGHAVVICSFPSALIESSILREKLETLKGGECLNLEGVSYPEVQAFLEVADARLVSGDKDFTFRQLVYALSVAEHLQLDHIRSYVAKSIEDGLTRLDPFECIEIADKRRTQEWLLQPFRRICQRVEPLSSSEMYRLGFDRASAVARARENLMKAIESTKYFSDVYRGSAIPSYAQPTLEKYAIQVVKAEPLLCQLAPEQVLSTGAPMGHTQIHSSNLSSSNLIIMKLRDCLYRLPLHYFGSESLIHKLVASRAGQGPVSLPDDLDTSDWEAFLKIITARPYDQPEASYAFSEWMGGLRVAKRLNHDCALAYIFSQIQKAYPKQDPVDLLEAARLADASHSPWLQDRFATLSLRSTAISSEEMRRMGEDAAAEVCKMREQAAYKRGKTDGEASSPAKPMDAKPSYPATPIDPYPSSPAKPRDPKPSYPATPIDPYPSYPTRPMDLGKTPQTKPMDLDDTPQAKPNHPGKSPQEWPIAQSPSLWNVAAIPCEQDLPAKHPPVKKLGAKKPAKKSPQKIRYSPVEDD
ncbi:hypothetical protein FRC01_005377, partial [Tulasnella sp. 417]